MKRRINHDGPLFSLFALIAGLAIIVPLLFILRHLFEPSTDAWRHIRQIWLLAYIRNTSVMIFWTAFGTALIGTYAAVLTTRYTFFGVRVLSWMLVLPLAVPAYIAGYVYADMLSYTGTVTRFLRLVSLPQLLQPMTMAGAVFIFVFTLYPYVYLFVRAALKRQSAAYAESALTLGVGPFRAFFLVVLPLLRPALIGGVFLVVLETLNDYGLVAYFNIRVFSFAIFNAWFSFGEVVTAIRLSAVLLIMVFVILVLERVLRGHRRYTVHVKGRVIAARPLRGLARVVHPFCLWLILGFGFLFPTMQLMHYAVLTWRNTLNMTLFYNFMNTLTIALGSTALIVVIALMLANFGRFRPKGWKRAWLKATTLGYAIPGAVIAIAVNLFFITVDRQLYPLYRWLNPASPVLVLSMSLGMLVFAYILRFMAIGYNSIEAGYDKLGETFTEAAYTLNHRKLSTLLKIDVPLLKSSLFAAAVIVFIDVVKELPLTLILRPANYDTLASRIYEYASDEMIQDTGVASLILIMMSALLIYALSGPKKRGRSAHVRPY
ncbi:MAG: iron ABC transporter permease [Acholeplasmatales bacterium]|nr:MAG: iron ABC transporter permease [Acholeplasmatales bacterium]